MSGRDGRVSVEDYRKRLLDGLMPLPPVQLPLARCLGLVTAEAVTARVAVPPFTNSAMDGFAVRHADVATADPAAPIALGVVGDLAAGSRDDPRVGDGQAVRIMTGAPLPAGADAVVPVELTDQPLGRAGLPEIVRITGSVARAANIRLAGEDVAIGAPILPAGVRVDATAIAAAASAGHGTLLVHPAPRVAVIATGAELVEPGQPLDTGQIPDSNGPMLAGLVAEFGAVPMSLARCPDDPAALDAAVTAALDLADVVITNGGVSVGVRDVVKNSAVADALEFARVSMRPGKPQGHGRLTASDGRVVSLLALPGNPVSVFVSWFVFVVPVLAALAGLDPASVPSTGLAPVGTGWRSPRGFVQFMPVMRLPDGTVAPSHRLGAGSHLIASLHRAGALAVVPADVTEVTSGGVVDLIETRRGS